MKIERLYRCNACGHRFRRRMNVDQIEEPACPNCDITPQRKPFRVAAPAITGTKAKAIDLAQQIAEREYGMTNMRDNSREGDIAYIAPPPAPPIVDPTSGQSIPSRPSFMWGGKAPSLGAASPMRNPAGMIAAAAPAAAAANAIGANPMEILHRSKPKMKINVVGRHG